VTGREPAGLDTSRNLRNLTILTCARRFKRRAQVKIGGLGGLRWLAYEPCSPTRRARGGPDIYLPYANTQRSNYRETIGDQMNAIPPTSQPSAWLINQWAMAGIVSAASRFIPVPYAEEVVRYRCRRFVVSRTLSANKSSVSADTILAYYDTDGFFNSWTSKILRAPFNLLLFPIRKTVRIVTSVRNVPLEIIQIVLLGRTLDRCLQAQSPTLDAPTAKRMRKAFDEAFSGMDFYVVRAALIDALKSVSGLKTAAVAMARRVSRKEEPTPETLEPSDEVQSGAANVQSVLDRPETLALFAEFDRRFDQSLQKQVNR